MNRITKLLGLVLISTMVLFFIAPALGVCEAEDEQREVGPSPHEEKRRREDRPNRVRPDIC